MLGQNELPAGYAAAPIAGQPIQRMSKQPYYDTTVIGPGAAVLQQTFFQIPLGQALPVVGGAKTFEDSNLETAGQIPQPYNFFATGFGVNVQYGTLMADMNLIYNACSFQFFVGQTPFLQVPLAAIPTVGGFHGVTTENLVTAVCNGLPQVNNVFKVAMKNKPFIQLNPGETFRITLNWRAAITVSANTRIQVFMIGTQGVPVR